MMMMYAMKSFKVYLLLLLAENYDEATLMQQRAIESKVSTRFSFHCMCISSIQMYFKNPA